MNRIGGSFPLGRQFRSKIIGNVSHDIAIGLGTLLLNQAPRMTIHTLPLALLSAIFLFAAARPVPAAPRPNILYLYVDDMGWGSIGPNGQAKRQAAGDPHVLTPNLNQLAAEGVNFTRAYGCTVCSPARSSQQSGFHQGHTWADRNDPNNAKKAMRADDILMGDALAGAGYVTGYWGKWGYGASKSQDSPVIQNIQTLPSSHGYQHVLTELHHVRAHTFFQPTLWSYQPGDTNMSLKPNSVAAYANNPDYPNAPANQDHVDYPSTAYCDDSYAFAALDFVRAQAQHFNATGQPFFGLLAVQVPHSPYGDINKLPEWDGDYAGNTPFTTLSAQAQEWAAMVTRIDGHIGNLLAALEDPNNDGDPSDSIVNDTLVIFQSDNGGPDNNARTELNANGGLRGSKGSVYEGGIRVPAIIRWPSQIHTSSLLKAGTDSDLVIDITDLLPTFCELAGVHIPVGLDGVSLAPTLLSSGHQRHREFLIHEAGSSHSIIRGRHKLLGSALYDLEVDPSESNNIAETNPALVAELKALRLGERVTEPDDFANTYHTWTGNDGDATSHPDHWSDYVYANDGVTYDSDSGAPQLSWNATMINAGPAAATAQADADLSFLGFEIGGTSPESIQTLDLGSHTLTGRNEVRLAAHSALLLDNGTVSSLRWLDVQTHATLTGAGTIAATLYNNGTVAITQASGTTEPGPDITIPGPDITITDGHQYIVNGGFENGTDVGSGDYSYTTLENWFTDGPDPSKDGAKPNNPGAGIRRGLGNTGYPLVQTTAFPFLLGDRYTLSFQHRGFSGWTTGESARALLFYEDPDGTRSKLSVTTFAPTNGTWNPLSIEIPAITDANAIGKAVQVLLGPDTGTGFLSFDSVSLVRHGPQATIPGPDITEPGPDIDVPGHRRLDVEGDYHEYTGAALSATLAGATTAGEDYTQLTATGRATLAGLLRVNVAAGFSPALDDQFTILRANAITGTFANVHQTVSGSDGTLFRISYSATTVTLTTLATTAQGTPYSWLESFGIDGGDPEAADLLDHDGDGALAWEEFVAGTDPTQSLSVLRLQPEPSADGTGLTLRWPSAPGRVYRLYRSESLVAFAPVGGPISPTPPVNAHLISPLNGPREFFRISVELE